MDALEHASEVSEKPEVPSLSPTGEMEGIHDKPEASSPTGEKDEGLEQSEVPSPTGEMEEDLDKPEVPSPRDEKDDDRDKSEVPSPRDEKDEDPDKPEVPSPTRDEKDEDPDKPEVPCGGSQPDGKFQLLEAKPKFAPKRRQYSKSGGGIKGGTAPHKKRGRPAAKAKAKAKVKCRAKAKAHPKQVVEKQQKLKNKIDKDDWVHKKMHAAPFSVFLPDHNQNSSTYQV